MITIVYIHGHGASSASFNYIRSQLPEHECVNIEYQSNVGFDANLKRIVEHLKTVSTRIFFIAHSLGGIYALHAYKALGSKVVGAVTLSTPYGGAELALALNLLNPKQLYRDIHPNSDPITQALAVVIHDDCLWLPLVSTQGHAFWTFRANDGVVTRKSMCALNRHFVEIDSNHHEILQNSETLTQLKKSLLQLTQIEAELA